MTMHLRFLRQPTKSRAFLAALLIAFLVTAERPVARGADLAEQAHSLRTVPADTAFYSVSLRLKEQWEAFLGSRTYGKLMEIPLIQLAKMQATFQWQQSPQPTVAKVREYFASSAGQDSIAVLKEVFSDEVFAYGGRDISDALKLFMELNSIRRTARLEALARGEDPDEVTSEKILAVLNKHADSFKVPTVVLGFRISNAERAKSQLDEVHSMLRNLLDEHKPELAAHLQRDQIAGHEFLTLRLDGSMIPWDELHEKAEAEEGGTDKEQVKQWQAAISKKTLVVAIGVVDEYVLLSIGNSTEHLEHMGQGPFLAENPAIQKLAKHADQKLVSIGYLSNALAQNLNSPERTIEDIAGGIEEALAAAKVSEENRKLIVEDIRALDIKRYIPEPGEMTSVAYLTARGYEGFQYNSAKRPMMDSSKPLSILNHAGGAPALVIAARSKDSAEEYEKAVAWLKRTAPHVEKIVEEKADADDWAKYQEHRERLIALANRLDAASREHLIPALADGQSAVVIDVSARSKLWFAEMAESPKPLPMPGIAFVATVSDAEKLRQGLKDYIAVLKDAMKLAREMNPDETPEVELPKPDVRELDAGRKLYVYAFPSEWGVDSQVAVNAGIANNVAVVSAMPATSERLMQGMPLAVEGGLKLDRPAALVVHIDFSKMIAAARPWIDYGFDVAMGKLKPKKKEDAEDDSDDESPPELNPMVLQMGFVVPQIHQFLEVASALKSASSVSYEEDGVWVTHSETHIED